MTGHDTGGAPMTAPDCTHDLAEVVAGFGEPYMPVLTGAPNGEVTGEHWVRYDQASEADALAERLEEMLANYEEDAGVTTAFLCSRMTSPLALLGARPVVIAGRGLLLDASKVWLRRHPRGWHNGISLVDPQLIVAADDPLAADATQRDHVTVVDDRDAVRDAAMASMLALATPVIERLHERGHLGLRALWGQLADLVVTAAARPRDAAGDAETALADARALLAVDDRLWVEPTVARVEVGGGCGLAWRRGSCCLAYRLDRFEYCTGCPLIGQDEWWERSVASIAERVGETVG